LAVGGTTLRVGRDGAVATLNRPEKLNSLNEAMDRELREALGGIEGGDAAVRAVLITGAGKGFCTGQDFGDGAMTAGEGTDLGATIEATYNPLVRRLRALERPVVCAVNGVAAGAGANLALACDIVLAARSARFIQAFSVSSQPRLPSRPLRPTSILRGENKALPTTEPATVWDRCHEMC
jgi:2-(1,2-epoxy-1,2-dihydrophenyl)acetyl-CoA isomerase